MTPQILQSRENLRPICYPQFLEAHSIAVQSPWSPTEVAMAADLEDWYKLPDIEKKIIAGLLKGFTITEAHVGCYWRDIVAKQFGQPEVKMMATSFSHQETVHLLAYDHLEATLNLDTYKAFKADLIANEKVSSILSFTDTKSLALSLAIFSGAVEGVSLFGSFAVLLSFAQSNHFKGLGQILSWSIADESLHSDSGIALYHQLLNESPQLAPSPKDIYNGFDKIVTNEINFIENVFGNEDLRTITKKQTIDFIKYKANQKLMQLNLAPTYDLTGGYRIVKHFFNSITGGKTFTDFFARAKSGGNYSAMLSQSFLSELQQNAN
jgi:ribonucleoside-diphosphate reductase beta chain